MALADQIDGSLLVWRVAADLGLDDVRNEISKTLLDGIEPERLEGVISTLTKMDEPNDADRQLLSAAMDRWLNNLDVNPNEIEYNAVNPIVQLFGFNSSGFSAGPLMIDGVEQALIWLDALATKASDEKGERIAQALRIAVYATMGDAEAVVSAIEAVGGPESYVALPPPRYGAKLAEVPLALGGEMALADAIANARLNGFQSERNPNHEIAVYVLTVANGVHSARMSGDDLLTYGKWRLGSLPDAETLESHYSSVQRNRDLSYIRDLHQGTVNLTASRRA